MIKKRPHYQFYYSERKLNGPKAEFKEFEPQLKYGWFRLNFSRFKPALICIQFFEGFETRLKFIKLGHWFENI